MLKGKLQNIISGYRINEDDAAWLLDLEAKASAARELPPRRFRTRNGSILEPSSYRKNGYRCTAGITGDLRVISSTDPSVDPGSSIYLCVVGCDLPEGGAAGPGWDVVEELTSANGPAIDLRRETLEEDARDIEEESK